MSVVAWLFVIAAVALLAVSAFSECRRVFQFALVVVLAYSILPVIGVTA